MNIQILGTGCPKCQALERRLRDVLSEMGLEAGIEKVTDIKAIMASGILTTPGLVINGQVRSSGRIPRSEELKSWLQTTAS